MDRRQELRQRIVARLIDDPEFVLVARSEAAGLAADVAEYVHEAPGQTIQTGFDTVVLRGEKGTLSGESVRARNILVNLGELLEAVSAGAFSIAGVISDPWLAPFGLLLLCRSLRSGFRVPLSEVEAQVLLVLWSIRDNEGISLPDSLERELSRNALAGAVVPTHRQISAALASLEQLDCIVPAGDGWRVVETLRLEGT